MQIKTAMYFSMSIFLALLVPMVPVGVFFRFLLLMILFFLVFICWFLRCNTNNYHERLINFITLSVVFLSVVWPRYAFYKIGPLPRVNPYSVMLFLSVIILIVSLIYSPVFCGKVKYVMKDSKGILMLVFVWLLWRFVSNIISAQTIISMAIFFREIIYIASFVFIGAAIATNENAQTHLVIVIIFAACFVGLAGLYESYTFSNPFLALASQDEDGAIYDLLKNIAHDKTRDGVYRVQSVFSHPIVFAQYMAAILPLAFFLFKIKKSIVWRSGIAVFCLLAILMIYKSGARSGYIGVIVGLSSLASIYWVRTINNGYISRVIALLLFPVLIVGAGFCYYFISTLVLGQSSMEANSGLVRLIMIKNGVLALSDSPLFGYGDGMAATVAGLVSTTGIMTIDNYFLSIAVDGGYCSILIFTVLFIILIWRAFVYSIHINTENGIFVAAAVSSIMSLLSVFSIVSITDNMTLMWLLVTAIIGVISRTSVDNGTQAISSKLFNNKRDAI